MTEYDWELLDANRVGGYFAPHCDGGILHAPQVCVHCDEYPAWQRYRLIAGIAFTGEPPTDDKVSCPSEIRRGLESLYAWGGNRPQGSVDGAG